MSLYIPSLNLPPKGQVKMLVLFDDGIVLDNNDGQIQLQAIEVPEHGRLGDLDALTDTIERTDWYHQSEEKNMVHGANSAEHQAWYKAQDVYVAIDNAPTVIPADKEGGADG